MAKCQELCDQPDWTLCVFCQSSSSHETLIRVTEIEPNVETILGYLKHDVQLRSKLRRNETLVVKEGQCHLACFKDLREKTMELEQNNLIVQLTQNLRRDMEKGSVVLLSDLWQQFCTEANKTPIARDIIALPKDAFRSMVESQMSDVADFVVNEIFIPKKYGTKTLSKTVNDHTYSGMLQVASVIQSDMQHHNEHGTLPTSTSNPDSLDTFLSILSKCKSTTDNKGNTDLKDVIAKKVRETNKPLQRFVFN